MRVTLGDMARHTAAVVRGTTSAPVVADLPVLAYATEADAVASARLMGEAGAVTARLSIPTVGIGAGAGCSGRVQVWHDLLRLGTGQVPRHPEPCAEVASGAFPTAAQSSAMDEAALAQAPDGVD